MLLSPPTPLAPACAPLDALWPAAGIVPLRGRVVPAGPRAQVDPDEDEDLAEDDLPLSEPTDEESNFDDFDDEFDDDFEEEESDPDWDHPDDGDAEPPPAKGPGGKK